MKHPKDERVEEVTAFIDEWPVQFSDDKDRARIDYRDDLLTDFLLKPYPTKRTQDN